MSTFSRRFFVKILAFLLVFSLVYAPIGLLPHYPISSVHAQGEGNQNGDGNSGGATVGGGDPTSDFGGYTPDQVMGSPGLAAALSEATGLMAGIASFFGGFNAAIGFNPVTGLFDVTYSHDYTVAEIGLALLGLVLGGIPGLVAAAGSRVAHSIGGTVVSVSYSGSNGVTVASRSSDGEVTTQTSQIEIALNGQVTGVKEGESPTSSSENQDLGNLVESTRNEAVSEGVPNAEDIDTVPEAITSQNERIAQNGESQSTPPSLSASPVEVDAGGNTVLQWSSDVGSACYTQGYHWTGIAPAQGSVTVENITRDQVFLMRCVHTMEYSSGSDNAQPTIERREGLAYAEVRVRNATPAASTTPGRPQTVQPQPVRPQPSVQQNVGSSGSSAQGLSINVSPSSVSAGGQATLSWSAEGQRSCVFR